MRARMAVGDRRPTRQGSVCPAEGYRGAVECPPAPRRPRRLPMVVPTVQPAGDVRLAMGRYQVGLAIQAP
jgi:hypothetical protein